MSIPDRCAIYLRVSTKKQAEKYSLPTQRKILGDICKKRGWKPVLYDEGAASGETIRERPVMQRLLADAAEGKLDLVLVVETERLCRASDLRDWATITTTLRDAGVKVATPERIFDLGAAEDDFESDLRGILSKREKRKLLERTKRGRMQAKDEGRYIGGKPPWGYRYDPAARSIRPIPGRIPALKRIFAHQGSVKSLHRKLAVEGVPIREWDIRSILRNPSFAGYTVSTTGEMIRAEWPGVVSLAAWKRAQAARPRETRDLSEPAYLLTGLLRCAACGGPVRGLRIPTRPLESGEIQTRYRCARAYVHTSYSQNEHIPCPRPGSIATWILEAVVLEAARRYISDPDRLARLYEDFKRELAASRPSNRVRELDARLAGLRARRTRLIAAVEEEALDLVAVRARSAELELEERKVREARARVLADLHPEPMPSLRTVLAVVEAFPWPSRKATRRGLAAFLEVAAIDFASRSLVATWRFGGSTELRIPRIKAGPGRSRKSLRERLLERLSFQV